MSQTNSTHSRRESILNELKNVIHDLGGLDRDKIPEQANFLDLGFDSLFLAQMSGSFKKKFGVNVSFRQLLEDLPTPDALARYIDSKLPDEDSPVSTAPAIATVAEPPPPPEENEPAPQPVVISPPAMETSSVDTGSGFPLEKIFSQQLEVMAGQLETLRHCQFSQAQSQTPKPAPENPGDGLQGKMPDNGLGREATAQKSAAPSVGIDRATEARPFGPWKPIDKSGNQLSDLKQRKLLDDLILRYTTRTRKSKDLTAAHRAYLADPRAVSGFRSEWKEMIYPIVAARSSGAKLWDIDGNEYVDLIMGFGSAFFGHSPQFLVTALREQMTSGIEIGPQSPIAGEVARLICDLTGMERVSFCNTGSEAVLAALRVARTVTGRDKVAMFAGSYHGIFDEVLVRPTPTRNGLRPVPVAPGIPPRAVEDMLVLDYGASESLDMVERHANELAAVLVEPVQSRNPDLQPREFLRALRELTARSGIALIFDEVITGFRLAPGGAQEWMSVRADLATYGKALGAGVPIGALAGRARFMDALDGGTWRYGDGSVPEADVTYFAGTFVRHPLAMAGAYAVLRHLKEQGCGLYRALNDKASALAENINGYFEDTAIPIHLQRCGSLFSLGFQPDTRHSSLFFYYLRLNGLHIWEGRPTFISTAHTGDDLALVVKAFKESADEMRGAGFFPSSPDNGIPKKPKSDRSVGRKHAASDADSRGEPTDTAPATSDAPIEFPLTEAQLEIWLATRLGTEASQAFNENILLRLTGKLDLGAMRAALQRTVDRHEALRSTFADDGSVQRVHSRFHIDIPLIDLSGVNDSQKKTRLDELLTRDLQGPFDLVNGPLIRASAIKMNAEEHFLLITAHHLVCDGWASHVLLRDLSVLYSGAPASSQADLPEPVPFREYAAWQQKQSEGPEGAATERYWLDRLANSPPPLKLPADRPKPPFRTFNGSAQRIQIEPENHTGMKLLGRSQGCTAFTTYLAAFKVLLHRLTAQDDIVVGIVMAGQSIFGAEELAGHCVNTLPLRNRIDPNQSFISFLKSVNGSFLDAYEHQNYTFGTIVKKLQIIRDPGQMPLISVMFNMDQALGGLRFGNLEFELHPDPNPFANFDLSFNLVENQDRLNLECEYNRDLFNEGTIRRWMRLYEQLLRTILDDPDRPISCLPLLSRAERHEILTEWNQTEVSYPEDLCIHELFERQVERSPNQPAITFGDQKLTYRELDGAANQLAHYLRKLGVGPEVTVAICLEPSVDMVVSLLGVLKAGGAYVPLDLTWPRERLALVLRDCHAAAVLTQDKLRGCLPCRNDRIVCVDERQEIIGKESKTSPPKTVSAENLAYVIYTSGTTGLPKGVMVEHKSLTNYFDWFGTAAFAQKIENLPVISRTTFDASVKQLFGPLLRGRCVWVIPEETLSQPAKFLKALRTRPGVGVNCTPSFWSSVVNEIDPATADVPRDPLSLLLLGGEVATPDLIKKTYLVYPEVEIWNLYGPTETTINASAGRIPAEGPITIGRSIANVQTFILDPNLQPVPIGIPGQLYVGGIGVTRGYWNRPDLTAERFIPSPFSGQKRGVRLYKTGDMARYCPDGAIEFLGRLDTQVKVRGFRVELGEIETVLGEHPQVQRTMMAVHEDGRNEKRLVAYVVSTPGAKLSSNDLRTFLKSRLPDYMVPSAFIFIETLPVSHAGKVNPRALPVPDLSGIEIDEPFVPPRTLIEETLAGIWREVLEVNRVGVHDNFFELGGHSLLAVKIISRIGRAWGIDLPLRVLFEHPTIEQLAKKIVASETEQLGADALVRTLQEIESLSDQEAAKLMDNG